MSRLFGTDGVRGVANHDLTPDLALALGRAAGMVLASGGGEVLVGRDTRLSGPMLEGALVAGLCSAGARVRLAGIIPSPGVSFLTIDENARAGAMISASHNPISDNGIKFFSDEGTKITAEREDAIERHMKEPTIDELGTGLDVGTVSRLADAKGRYVRHLLSTLDGRLEGLKVVLDCAYGAGWETGPATFAAAGATVVAIHAEPDGARINVDCGSTSMSTVARRVVEEEADLGLALDGDADRVLAVDERGEMIDGDRILALSALRLHDVGALKGDVVVATVMSNLAMTKMLESHGIEVLAAPVGDRFVVESMLDRGAVLGGEQSGHVIFGEHAHTGDGILTGLQIAQAVRTSGSSLHELAHLYEPYPQVLINVPVAARGALEQAEAVWSDVAAAERTLGDDGRVLLRASGTEPVVRVMVEAADRDVAARIADELASSLRRHLA
ncbi:MAG: phosphoglucosamine mutase [Actinomycetota bacterium]